MKKLSLRWRITLFCGVVFLLCTVVLTMIASKNAGHQFENLSTELIATGQSPQALIPLDPEIIGPVTISPIPWNQVTEAKKEFDSVSIFACIIISILGMGTVYLITAKSLKPISDFSEQIETITQNNLYERIPDMEYAKEINSLCRSFNAMLDRLDTSFQQQRQFSANVAHE